MRIDDDQKTYLFWDADLSFDPTGSTPAIEVGGTSYAMAWQGTPVQSGTSWTQTARTTQKFCGSSATASGSDVKLPRGVYPAQVLLTTADGTIPDTETRLVIA